MKNSPYDNDESCAIVAMGPCAHATKTSVA
jgi:hypothetical protein